MNGKSTTLAIRVPLELRDKLQAMAKADKRTLSQFCYLILAAYVEEQMQEKK